MGEALEKQMCLHHAMAQPSTCAVLHHEVKELREKQVENATKISEVKDSIIRHGERLQGFESAQREIKDYLLKLSDEVRQSSLAIAKNSTKTAWVTSITTALICGVVLGIFNFMLRGAV